MSVYAVSDLHGRYDLYEKIKEILEPEDTVFFLGDANDRGPDGWKLIKAIYNDPQFIYLKGNHEDMLANAMSDGRDDYYDLQLLYMNGGFQTYEDWLKEPDRNKWYLKLKNLPLYWRYKRLDGAVVLLSHAGFTPQDSPYSTFVWGENLLWDRKHFKDPWDPVAGENTYVVHGHTPVTHLGRYLGTPDIEDLVPAFYCNDHKIDIDLLSAFTGTTCLLNLDTFEHIKIEVKEKN